jgi:hypothetical protein
MKSQSRHEKLYDLFPEMSSELKRVGMTRYLLWERYLKENPSCVVRFFNLTIWVLTLSP